jgi:hypothetical protein
MHAAGAGIETSPGRGLAGMAGEPRTLTAKRKGLQAKGLRRGVVGGCHTKDTPASPPQRHA